MVQLNNLKFCGIPVSAEELALIKEVIKDCGGLSRTELAHTVCELLNWRRPTGGLKAHECRYFLDELEEKGVLSLPGIRKTKTRGKIDPKKYREDQEPDTTPLEGTLRELGPLELELLKTKEDRDQWKDWVARYHYLGCTVPFGAFLRYFVRLNSSPPRRVGCIQVSSSAWRMAERDRWIGWNDEERVRGLQRIVQNSRFLLVPWVKVPHLASASLARLARQLADDWEAAYAVRPFLLETLVDPARFKGTCYRAANWIYLGQTAGRGRMDRANRLRGEAIKDILVYPLCRKAVEKLLEVSRE